MEALKSQKKSLIGDIEPEKDGKMSKKGWIILTFLAVALVLTACGGGGSSATSTPIGTPVPTPPAEYAGKTNPYAGQASAASAGETIFQTNCSPCHGADAKGDGPAAASLNPKPADLALLQGQFSDAYLFWRISEGGLNPPFNSAMPSWKSTLTEEQIWQVITYLRTLKP
jgi:mono/diheme cytochrome c family protein